MWKKDDREPIFRFILLTAAIWIGQLVILRLLQPYSAAYTETGTMTAGYILYAAVGLLFSTPGPFWAMLILSVRVERIGLGEFFRRIFAVRRTLATVSVLLLFCGSALIFGLLYDLTINNKTHWSPSSVSRRRRAGEAFCSRHWRSGSRIPFRCSSPPPYGLRGI